MFLFCYFIEFIKCNVKHQYFSGTFLYISTVYSIFVEYLEFFIHIQKPLYYKRIHDIFLIYVHVFIWHVFHIYIKITSDDVSQI